MTVRELYEKLKLEIEAGHGDVAVTIYDTYPETDDDCGWTEEVKLEDIYYHEKAPFSSEHVELGRY